jgi:hypothetical protein
MWEFFDFNGDGFTIEDLFWYFTFIATILVPTLVIIYRKSILVWFRSIRNRRQRRRAEAVTEVVTPIVKKAVEVLHEEIRKEIKDATKQIQPDSNGGMSLPDLHNKLDVVSGQLELILDYNEQLADGLRDERLRLDTHLTYHISNPK